MKTRSNMPLFVIECEDVKALSNSQIDLLRCGDYLVKKDASGEHAYKVTFKSDTGMCITYHDASVIETQSYDKVDGNWVYNSEDKTPNLLELQNVEDAPDGTINKALGLDTNGDLVKGTISGGTKLYKHRLKANYQSTQVILILYTNNKEQINNLTKLYNALFSVIYGYEISDSGDNFMSILINTPVGEPFIAFSYFSTSYPGGNITFYRKVLNLTTMEYSTTTKTITSSFNFTDTVTEL